MPGLWFQGFQREGEAEIKAYLLQEHKLGWGENRAPAARLQTEPEMKSGLRGRGALRLRLRFWLRGWTDTDTHGRPHQVLFCCRNLGSKMKKGPPQP